MISPTLVKLIDEAILPGLILVLAQQNLLEFYSTITDPKRVRSPLPVQEARFAINEYLTSYFFSFIYPKRTTAEETFKLAKVHQIKKAQIFDVFLVATMLDNGTRTIYTDDEKHFKFFKEIKAVNPLK